MRSLGDIVADLQGRDLSDAGFSRAWIDAMGSTGEVQNLPLRYWPFAPRLLQERSPAYPV